MTRAELVATVAQATGLPNATAAIVVETILAAIRDALAGHEAVRLAGFGTFAITTRPASTGRSPTTGNPVPLTVSRMPRFTPDRRLNDLLSSQAGELPKRRAGRAGPTAKSVGRRAAPPAKPGTGGKMRRKTKSVAPRPRPVADEVFVTVHFATNRKPTGTAEADAYYGAEYGDDLGYGRLTVSLPRRHKMGAVERPTIWDWWRENPADHVMLRSVAEMKKHAFFTSLSAAVRRLRIRRTFVFIHGFNVEFAEAARRAAQMAYDLFCIEVEDNLAALSAVPILFSWPSQGRVVSYPHDENHSRASAPHLETFLRDVAIRSGADEITVIAHSMGNQPLVTALENIGRAMQGSDGPLIREIVLAAADIDERLFRQAAIHVARTGRRVTLYASDCDKALRASIRFNGFRRAGDATGGVVVVDDIDSIDASVLGDDMLAHSYVGEVDILKDLHALMTSDASPGGRFGLIAVGDPPQRYWRVRPRRR